LPLFNKDMLVDAGIANIGKNNQLYYPLEGRIIFPWCDEDGQVRGLTGRWIGDVRPERTPKYINSRTTDIFQKSKLLWGLHLAKEAISKTGQLLVVEGYTDVMALHKAGIEQVVSPIGISISRSQLEKLFSLNDNPLVCLDGDEAGQKASVDVANRALAYLKEIGPVRARGKSLSFALLPGRKDPDEIIRKGGVAAFRDAIAHPLSLEQMIELGEAIKRRAGEDRARIGGMSVGLAGDGTPSQDGERFQHPSRKRAVPHYGDDQEPSRQRRRSSKLLRHRSRERSTSRGT
jgi:DNA primase